MHADITPLAPITNANSLYHIMSVSVLHWICVVAGAAAAAWLLLRSNNSLERSRER
jgi:hypothetical protein